METDDICQNCSSFIGDIKDLAVGFGICIEDEAFDLFLDDIIENADFSRCCDLYLEKRFSGVKIACSHYEEPETFEISNEDDIYGYIIHEKMKHQNVDEIIKYLYSSNSEITSISSYIALGNNDAYEGLINYYIELAPADSLEDVHIRMEIIKALSSKIREPLFELLNKREYSYKIRNRIIEVAG